MRIQECLNPVLIPAVCTALSLTRTECICWQTYTVSYVANLLKSALTFQLSHGPCGSKPQNTPGQESPRHSAPLQLHFTETSRDPTGFKGWTVGSFNGAKALPLKGTMWGKLCQGPYEECGRYSHFKNEYYGNCCLIIVMLLATWVQRGNPALGGFTHQQEGRQWL